MWHRSLPVVLALVLAGTASSADGAASALTATQIRAGSHPAFVRVVVDFAGGAVTFNTTNATDPDPFDGTARVEVARAGVRSVAAPLRALGVTTTVARVGSSLRIRLAAAPRRFKYLGITVLHAPERVVLDLWRSAPTPPARFGRPGCLTIDRVAAGPVSVQASGRERDLFEHSLVARLRGARGGLVSSRPLIGVAGRWSARLGARVPRQLGTLEAVSFSAKDGSLDCLAQLPVRLGA